MDARLHYTNFSGANFTRATLTGVDFQDVSFKESSIKGFDTDRLLSNGTPNPVGSIKLERADTIPATFTNANLAEANLTSLNLEGFRFEEANLIGANLSGVFAIGTDFTGAILTGACLKDWNINGTTKLDGVHCEYVYLERSQQERRPSVGKFAFGEFTKLFHKVLQTVDLIFIDGIDWKAFLQSFQELQLEYDEELAIQAIERKGKSFIIRLEVSSETDKAAIESLAKSLYERELKLREELYREKLNAKDREIENCEQQIEYWKQQNTNMNDIVKTLAGKELNLVVNVEQNPMTDQYISKVYNIDNRGAKIGAFANSLEGASYQQITQNNDEYSKDNTLSESAAEIQELLIQLEQKNPYSTEEEKRSYVSKNVSRTFQERALSALKAGGKTALDEFLDNPYMSVAISIIESWQETG